MKIAKADAKAIKAAAAELSRLTGDPAASIEAQMIRMAMDGRGPKGQGK